MHKLEIICTVYARTSQQLHHSHSEPNASLLYGLSLCCGILMPHLHPPDAGDILPVEINLSVCRH